MQLRSDAVKVGVARAPHRSLLKADGLRAEETRQGEAEFYVSDQPEDFERIASVFLQEDIRHVARRIAIDRY